MQKRTITKTIPAEMNVLHFASKEQKLNFRNVSVNISICFDGEEKPTTRTAARDQVTNVLMNGLAFDIGAYGDVAVITLEGAEDVIDLITVEPHHINPIGWHHSQNLTSLIHLFKDSVELVTEFWGSKYETRGDVLNAIKQKSPEHFTVLNSYLNAFETYQEMCYEFRLQKQNPHKWKVKTDRAGENLNECVIRMQEFSREHQINLESVLQIQ
jgi:hypothetical protein